MELVNFSESEEIFNIYRGSEKKKTLIHNETRYLVKFPDPLREKNKDISYINNAYSEYIGSKIFEMLGFETQKVVLGKYKVEDKEKIVCACEDFTNESNALLEFENLAISAVEKKTDTEIADIMQVIKMNENFINVEETIKMFWKIFIVDSLIGNTDRHNGNWGFLGNLKDKDYKFAPIYDNGSCLNPLLEDRDIEQYLNNETELKNIALNTYSCLKENNKKINYYHYINSLKNEECNKALNEIFPKIELEKINEMIDNIECISEIRKQFYKQIIKIKYDNILKNAYKKLNKIELAQNA